MPIGHSFIELKSVDSTNNYAMAQATAGAIGHGFVSGGTARDGLRGHSHSAAGGEPMACIERAGVRVSLCVGDRSRRLCPGP